MIAAIATFAAICAVGTVDQRDGDQLSVLGTTGVRVIAASSVVGDPHEGDRIELDPQGRCLVRGADPTLQRRIALRLRSLRR